MTYKIKDKNDNITELTFDDEVIQQLGEQQALQIELALMNSGSDMGYEKYEESQPVKTHKDTLSEQIESEAITKEKANEILKTQYEQQRRFTYAEQSDPLFFKWQRGEATKEEWELSIKKIKETIKEPEYFK